MMGSDVGIMVWISLERSLEARLENINFSV